eukprot:10867961-Prorocentrum_lima.AAC.1
MMHSGHIHIREVEARNVSVTPRHTPVRHRTDPSKPHCSKKAGHQLNTHVDVYELPTKVATPSTQRKHFQAV